MDWCACNKNNFVINIHLIQKRKTQNRRGAVKTGLMTTPIKQRFNFNIPSKCYSY